jgi:cytochrome c553
MTMRLMILLLLAAVPMAGRASDPPPQSSGIESPEYVWNKMEGEKLQALRATGNVARGETAFKGCRGCHRSGGKGRPDGSYPRLAGQHAVVLIKQITDIRAGRRDNAKMYPFSADHVLTTQEIADIALFLQGQPVTPDQGTGPGTDVDRGTQLYARDCVQCHGARGEGNAAEFYPRVNGQHFLYLVREARAIRDGQRRNANPKMVQSVKAYSDADLDAVSDYMSRLPPLQ